LNYAIRIFKETKGDAIASKYRQNYVEIALYVSFVQDMAAFFACIVG